MTQEVKELQLRLKTIWTGGGLTRSSQKKLNEYLAAGWTLQQVVSVMSGYDRYVLVRDVPDKAK